MVDVGDSTRVRVVGTVFVFVTVVVEIEDRRLVRVVETVFVFVTVVVEFAIAAP